MAGKKKIEKIEDIDEREIQVRDELGLTDVKIVPKEVYRNNILQSIGFDDTSNSKFIKLNLVLFNMPDIDLHDVEQVEDRINDYFVLHNQVNVKPTVSGLGLALGLDRRRLYQIKTGTYGTNKAIQNLPTETKVVIKKTYLFLENLWENYMSDGKINPASGIFLGKNNYGYKDVVENVITPNQTHDEDFSADEIKKRYE